MPSFPYISGDGTLRNRAILGSGTLSDPDIGVVNDVEGNLVLNVISGKLPTLGQKAASGSVSVVQSSGSVFTTTNATYNNFRSIGVSAGGNIKATSGSIFSLAATNANATIRFIQIFDKATAPTSGDVPMLVYPVYPNYGMITIDTVLWGLAGLGLANGISWGFSSTQLTYTAATGSDCVFELRWL
jgi:hypothetical protein